MSCRPQFHALGERRTCAECGQTNLQKGKATAYFGFGCGENDKWCWRAFLLLNSGRSGRPKIGFTDIIILVRIIAFMYVSGSPLNVGLRRRMTAADCRHH